MVKNLPANARDAREAGLICRSGTALEGRNGNPLQYSCLDNSMDRGAWWATVHEISKIQTQLRDGEQTQNTTHLPSKHQETVTRGRYFSVYNLEETGKKVSLD